MAIEYLTEKHNGAKIYKNKKRMWWLILLSIILLSICAVFPPRWLLIATQRCCYEKNPTSYVFHISKSGLEKLIPKDGSSDHDCYFRDGIVYITVKNEIGVGLHHSSDKIYDYTYRKIGGRRLINCYLFFAIEPISENECKVTFLPDKSEYQVTWGKSGYFGIHGDIGLEDMWIDVPPSDIQVYEILKFIGKLVGEKDMPPIHYPKSLSRKQILEMFGANNPFTTQEQFGD